MENDQDETGKPKGSGVESGPVAMGIAMAKKMMAQMGQGGSPMEIMQKMMGMCMGMCSEMLNAIRQTNALAVFATPELQHTFADWMKEIEARQRRCWPTARMRQRSPLRSRSARRASRTSSPGSPRGGRSPAGEARI